MLESIMSAGGETAGGGYPRPPHTLTLPSYPPSALTSMMGKIWGLNSLLSPPNSDIADQEDNKSGLFHKSMGPLSPTLFCGTPPSSMSSGHPSMRGGLQLPAGARMPGGHPPYITCNCGQPFPSLALLENHMAHVHPENTNIPCTLCNKQFPSLSKLQRHMSNHQDGPDLRKFKCSHCGKAFKFKHHLKEHERIHTGEKPFECKHCGKRFSHSGSYSSHTTSKKCLIGGRGRGNNGNNGVNANSNGTTPSTTAHGLLAQSKLNSGINSKASHNTPTSSWPVYKPEPRSTYPSPPSNGSDQPPHLTLPCFSPPPPPYHNPLFLLAAQNNPFLSRHFPPPGIAPPTSLESNLEHLHKLFKMHSEFGKLSSLETMKLGNANEEPTKVADNLTTQQETDGSVSPPRIDDTNNIEDKMNNTNIDMAAKIKTETDFKVVDSLRQSFSEQQNNSFHFFKNVLEGHRQTLRRGGFGAAESSVHGSEEDLYEDSVESEEGREEERKVRVRTLISEEQQMVLKAHYQRNPKPKKEVLQEVSATIGHPFRVVKVWFQNMRARDRREGRHIPQLPFPGSTHPAFLNNNFPGFQGINSLPLPLLRHPGSFLPPGLAGAPHLPFPFQSALQNMFDLPKTPESSTRSENNDGEVDDEDDNEDVDVEFESPLDLSNKGSTPGGSPIADDRGGSGDHVIVDPIGMSSLPIGDDDVLTTPGGHLAAKMYRGIKSLNSEERNGPVNLQLPEALFHCKRCESSFQDFLKYSQHLNSRCCNDVREDQSNPTFMDTSIDIVDSNRRIDTSKDMADSTRRMDMDNESSVIKASTTA